MEWGGLGDDLVAEVLKRLPLRVALGFCTTSRQTQRCAWAAAEWRLRLSGEQLAAFRDAMAGRNVFLTGGAGVGKSHTLRKIVAHLREDAYALTATTGAAAALIGATTLHSALGLPVGLPAGAKADKVDTIIGNIVQNQPLVLQRLKRIRTLIVDEIGMFGATQFDVAQKVVAQARRGPLTVQGAPPFGGVQIILCGDFLQLPPISDKVTWSKWVFQSETWPQLRMRVHALQVNHRSCGDDAFVRVLQRVRMGEGTQADFDWIVANQAQGEVTPDALRLFTKVAPAEKWNRERFGELVGRPVVGHAYGQWQFEPGSRFKVSPHAFHAVDQLPPGRPHLLEHSLAPKHLVLAVGARVMCLKNITGTPCVNGSLGTVASVRPRVERLGMDVKLVGAEIDVRFDGVLDGTPFTHTFQTYDSAHPPEAHMKFSVHGDKGKEIACRIQIPLKLAWAVSIHKSQGMSLDRAVISFEGCFEPGQAYTALSRMRSIRGAWTRGLELRHLRWASSTAKAWYAALPAPAPA